MATIDQLLGASPDDIEKMSDEELKIYLQDITNLEPKPLGKQIVGLESEKDDCPIKSRKKSSKTKKLSAAEQLAEWEKEGL